MIPQSVVDTHGQIHGIDGLRVGGPPSLFPTLMRAIYGIYRY